ncbi:hypothetical protein Tco_0937060 [Tanacetum coccineum]|uniref:Uncharacterized protein n=1 Tax=Tanacetum coccineum TaxID=301880 RepID=A0ABQ5DE00_9ASTR
MQRTLMQQLRTDLEAQKLISQLVMHDESYTLKKDLNQKFLRSAVDSSTTVENLSDVKRMIEVDIAYVTMRARDSCKDMEGSWIGPTKERIGFDMSMVGVLTCTREDTLQGNVGHPRIKTAETRILQEGLCHLRKLLQMP